MELQKVATTRAGKSNGWILPIFRDYDKFFDDYNIRFIYASSIAPRSTKGPHLHKKRQCMLVPIVGKTILVKRIDGEYVETQLDSNTPIICHIPTDIAFAMINKEDTEAIVLNLASHAWKQDDQDTHTVSDWRKNDEI